MALKARPGKETQQSTGATHQKKLDEFLKTVESSKGTLSYEELRLTFRDILVKSSILKEDDWVANRYIEVLSVLSKSITA